MTLPDSTSRYHDQVQNFFLHLAKKKARETKFVRHQSPLDGSLFLQTLVLNVFQFGIIVLDQLALTAHRLDRRVKVCGQAFKERFNRQAVEFLKQMFAEALQLNSFAPKRTIPLLTTFSEVNLLDSSTVTLPQALRDEYPGCGGIGAKAAAKVYLVLNYLTGSFSQMQIEAGRKADQNMGQQFLAHYSPGALWLFDLGFFDTSFLAQIAQAKSFFVCRLAASKTVFYRFCAAQQLEPFDLDHFLTRAARQLFEIEVVFGPHNELTSRLIIAPVPKEVAAERRRKVRAKARKNGHQPSSITLSRCDWTLLLTNTSAEQLPTSTVLEVYRVRWQVELAFKLFKSDARLETSLGREKYRVQCEFYAKLIALLLFNRLSGIAENLSGEIIAPAKLWRRMRVEAETLQQSLGEGRAQSLEERLLFLARYVRHRSGKLHPSTLARLHRAAIEARQVTLKDPPIKLRGAQPAAEKALIFTLKSHKITLNWEQLGFQRTSLLPLAYGNL